MSDSGYIKSSLGSNRKWWKRGTEIALALQLQELDLNHSSEFSL